MKKMSILLIANAGEKGGATNSFIGLVNLLNKNPLFNLILLIPCEGKISKFADNNKIEYIITGHKAFFIQRPSSKLKTIIKTLFLPFYYIQYYVSNKRAMNIVDKKINMKSISIIHTNVNRDDFGAQLSKKYKIPHIWHIREFGDLDYNCYSLRANYIKYMNDNANYFVTISNAVSLHWQKKGLDKKKIITIYNGVNRSKVNKNYNNKTDTIKIVFCGAIRESKGQIQAIKAIGLLKKMTNKNIKLDFYGNGDRRYIRYLNKIIKQSSLEKEVFFKGYSINLDEILPNYDIALTCSAAEGFGRITAEYMINGIAVIASDTGANPEIIINNKTGLLYEYGNIDDLAEKIKELIVNREKMVIISKNAKEFAIKNYTTDVNAKNISDLYLKLKEETYED